MSFLLSSVLGVLIYLVLSCLILLPQRYAMATLDGGQPCWMGVDVFKSYHTELGILDTGMYDYDLVYGVSPGAAARGEMLMSLSPPCDSASGF